MTSSKDKIIAAARGLMLTKGYPGTSVDEIISAAGVSKGSFYHAFKSKEELGAAVAEQYFHEAVAVIGTGHYEQIKDPLERAFAFVAHIQTSSQVLWNHGCMLGSFAMDVSGTHPAIASCLSRLMNQLEERISRLLEPIAAAGARADMPGPRDLANQMMASIEGGIVMAKAHGDPNRISQAINQFGLYLKALVK
jgi:TetR/AcrR family transcriptional repressor of nem operon